MVNFQVLWDAGYVQVALSHLLATDVHVKPGNVARLSPLGGKNFYDWLMRFVENRPTRIALTPRHWVL
jgi:hypothetical protein